VIQNQSAPIVFIGEVLWRHSPTALAFFGRNENDSYEAEIKPVEARDKYVPVVWKMVPPGSISQKYLGWMACRVRSTDSGTIWVGIETVVPHPTRGVFVEACYGLFSPDSAIQCLAEMQTLKLERNSNGTGKPTDFVVLGGERLRTEVAIVGFLESAIRDISTNTPINCRVPSLGTREAKLQPRTLTTTGLQKIAIVGGPIAAVSIFAATYFGGCFKR
jgi:hypothetical protein